MTKEIVNIKGYTEEIHIKHLQDSLEDNRTLTTQIMKIKILVPLFVGFFIGVVFIDGFMMISGKL